MRLLIAEDDNDISRALVALLKKDGYEVDAVDNGLDAYYYATHAEYDGIILDIMMPGLDGIGVLQKLREEGDGVPVLLLTAKGEVSDKVQGLDAGADDYLPKPFAISEFLARVRALVRRRSNFSSGVLKFDDVVLDKDTFELVYADKRVRLIMREFQMMTMFLESHDRIISNDRLMEEIWGWDSEVDVSVVWVYMSNLRKKIRSIDAPIEIQSARGIGYRLKAKE